MVPALTVPGTPEEGSKGPGAGVAGPLEEQPPADALGGLGGGVTAERERWSLLMQMGVPGGSDSQHEGLVVDETQPPPRGARSAAAVVPGDDLERVVVPGDGLERVVVHATQGRVCLDWADPPSPGAAGGSPPSQAPPSAGIGTPGSEDRAADAGFEERTGSGEEARIGFVVPETPFLPPPRPRGVGDEVVPETPLGDFPSPLSKGRIRAQRRATTPEAATFWCPETTHGVLGLVLTDSDGSPQVAASRRDAWLGPPGAGGDARQVQLAVSSFGGYLLAWSEGGSGRAATALIDVWSLNSATPMICGRIDLSHPGWDQSGTARGASAGTTFCALEVGAGQVVVVAPSHWHGPVLHATLQVPGGKASSPAGTLTVRLMPAAAVTLLPTWLSRGDPPSTPSRNPQGVLAVAPGTTGGGVLVSLSGEGLRSVSLATEKRAATVPPGKSDGLPTVAFDPTPNGDDVVDVSEIDLGLSELPAIVVGVDVAGRAWGWDAASGKLLTQEPIAAGVASMGLRQDGVEIGPEPASLECPSAGGTYQSFLSCDGFRPSGGVCPGSSDSRRFAVGLIVSKEHAVVRRRAKGLLEQHPRWAEEPVAVLDGSGWDHWPDLEGPMPFVAAGDEDDARGEPSSGERRAAKRRRSGAATPPSPGTQAPAGEAPMVEDLVPAGSVWALEIAVGTRNGACSVIGTLHPPPHDAGGASQAVWRALGVEPGRAEVPREAATFVAASSAPAVAVGLQSGCVLVCGGGTSRRVWLGERGTAHAGSGQGWAAEASGGYAWVSTVR